MANVERDIAEAVLAGSGLTPAKLGLRFDRVVGRVLGDLRAFADGAAPAGVTLVVTVTAPIRQPAKTVDALRQAAEAMHRRSAAFRRHSTAPSTVTPARVRLVGRAANVRSPG